MKKLIIKLLECTHSTLSYCGNKLHHFGVALEIKTTRLHAKMNYKKMYLAGSTVDIVQALVVDGTPNVREVYVMEEGLDSVFVFDYESCSVIKVAQNRLFNTESEALDFCRNSYSFWLQSSSEVKEKRKYIKKQNVTNKVTPKAKKVITKNKVIKKGKK